MGQSESGGPSSIDGRDVRRGPPIVISLELLISLLSIGGLLTFAILREVYERYYDHFYVDPEEVGLDYATIIGRAAIPLTQYVAYPIALLTVGRVLGWLLEIDVSRWLSQHLAVRLPVWFHPRRFALILLVVLSIAGVWYLVATWFEQADNTAARLKRGVPPIPESVLVFSGRPVEISWVNPRTAVRERLSSELLFLGRSEGTAVVYDVADEVVERVPVDSALLTSACSPSYPDVCLPRAPDLDCRDLGFGNVKTQGRDPHGFDSDGDKVGCEQGAPLSEPLDASFVWLSLGFILLGMFWPLGDRGRPRNVIQF